MNIITLTPRWDDIHAHANGNLGIWGCGKSVNEAVRDLVSAHQKYFSIELNMNFGERPIRPLGGGYVTIPLREYEDLLGQIEWARYGNHRRSRI